VCESQLIQPVMTVCRDSSVVVLYLPNWLMKASLCFD